MEESNYQIRLYDSSLNRKIAEIIELYDQISQTKTYFLSKIDSTLMRTIEDAQGIKEKYNSVIYLFLIIIKNTSVFLILHF